MIVQTRNDFGGQNNGSAAFQKLAGTLHGKPAWNEQLVREIVHFFLFGEFIVRGSQ